MKLLNKPIKKTEKQFTVDIETEHTHTYQFANGCVSHNSTSCVLGTASGIHPHHAKRYIRRTQVNRTEHCGKVIQSANPLEVEPSVWSANGTDNVISFLCEVPVGAITKNQVSALDLLEKVKLTQQNWVEYGTRVDRCVNPKLRHNVSNTINVKDDEWDAVEKYIFDNQASFAGISLLAASGDLDYAQAPFSTVMTPRELVKEYGDASVFASGLVVDGLHAFDNNLWTACDTVNGITTLASCGEEPQYPNSRNYKDLANYFVRKEEYEQCALKRDWVRRVKQFADRYFDTNVKRATYCLKHVSLWKTWCDIKREHVEIDWSQHKEDNYRHQNASELSAQACSGGKCDLVI
jgi:ribonucleoside-triphosphate reductase (thioredoxin)